MREIMGINDGSWIEELIRKNSGILSEAIELCREEVKKMEKELKKIQRSNSKKYNNVDFKLRRTRCDWEDWFKRSLIDFWTRKNVLPKYGFPVDTVELQIAGKKREPAMKI